MLDTINVVIGVPLEEKYLHSISSIDPCLKVKDAASLIRADRRGKGMESDEKNKLDRLLAEMEVLFGVRIPRDLASRSPRLKWMHLPSAGAESLAKTDLLQSSVTITNSRGLHASPISECVVGMMLMLTKDFPRLLRAQQDREWVHYLPSELRGKTVGVVGLGSIGRAVAYRAKAFDMRVIATRRSAMMRGQETDVDLIYPAWELDELLRESDFVILSVPLTRETIGMIGESQLQAMKTTSFLINISRGRIVDEAVLIRALDEGWIAGAGLDVFHREPLPPDSKLWGMDNVIITPHITGFTPEYQGNVVHVFCENLKRYLAGKSLLNVVDKELGY